MALFGRRGLRLFRSAGFRLSIAYGTVFLFSFLALASFLWFQTVGLLQRQVEAAITADATGLIDAASGGIGALTLAIQERMDEDVHDEAVYLLLTPLGNVQAGNLAAWPAKVQQTSVFYELPITRDGQKFLAEVRAYDFGGGVRLLVGRDVGARAVLIRILRNTLLSSIGLVAVIGVGGALLLRSLFRRMVANVAATSAAIAAGDLAQRVPLSGRGDEFDRMAETINTMLDRIGTLMDGVRQVSNAIAHDLRTPIARARARLEYTAAHADSEVELHAAIERAIADLDGITAIFQALLRIAEIEAGSRRAAFRRLDLGPMLRDLGELYEAPAEEHSLKLVVDAPARLVVVGDRDLLQQAMANLIDNAIKFSPAGGEVRLTARRSADFAILEVSDLGPGMAEEDRGRAAERFFRGEQARNTPGSGLGLALVQAVAGLHRGELTLENTRPGLRASLQIETGMRES